MNKSCCLCESAILSCRTCSDQKKNHHTVENPDITRTPNRRRSDRWIQSRGYITQKPSGSCTQRPVAQTGAYGCQGSRQCVAVRCIVLQCFAVSGSALQCVAVCCSVLQCVAECCKDPWRKQVRVIWLVDVCDMPHLYVWQWDIDMWDMTHLFVRHDSCTCATWLVYNCDMRHMYVETGHPRARCNILQHTATHCNMNVCLYE